MSNEQRRDEMMSAMPTYEYACTSCGERTEAKQKFTDPPLEECPICGGKLRKLYSPVGIVFKGSGFYSTDARKAAASASGSATKTDDKKPGKKDKTEPAKAAKSSETSKTSKTKDG
jgi:putative FmdB family regulatory protein